MSDTLKHVQQLQQPPPPYNPYYQNPPQIQPHEHVQENSTKLNNFYAKYEISPYIQEDVDCLRDYEIILLCDDSGSMKSPSEYLSIETNTVVQLSRWDELKETVNVVVELGVLLDDSGVDVWFLNKSVPNKNIKTQQQVMELFNCVPNGRTPLTRVLRKIMSEHTQKPKLILIVTDGEPTDDNGNDDHVNFKKLLETRNAEHNRIGILACTTNEKNMEWLDDIDVNIKNIDVIDDYLSERDQILKVQGKDFTYTHGDHILKMLLGPILEKYDEIDEKKMKPLNAKSKSKKKSCEIM